MLYVKNTIIDYKTSGLSVKNVNTEYISTTALSTTYNAPPSITFTPQDGKGTGATAVGILEPVGLSASATSLSTALGVVSGGAGYAGVNTDYVSTFTSATGGSGASVLPIINSATSTLPTLLSVVGTTAGTIGTTDRYISFPYSGTGATMDYSFSTTEELLCNIFIVGGGGGGGSGRGGGGGGGGVLFEENVVLPIGNYIVKVGKGGASVGVSSAPSTGRGSSSSLFYNGIELYRVAGGGGGGTFNASYLDGDTGASGGGATSGGTGGVASSTLNIPNATLGTNGGSSVVGANAGGGGGGAFTAGFPSTTNVGGAGGSATNINIVSNGSYGGGGGGGALQGGTAGAGGAGAGAGGVLANGGNGTAGSGGGGGGGGRNTAGTTNYAGGTGGSGVIIIKYTLAVSGNGSIASGTLTTGSGYTEMPTIITAPPPNEPAIFGAVSFNSSGGYINIANPPAITNPTTNGFYNPLTFKVSFINNPVVAQGFCSTDASGTLTNIIISNSSTNGYYRSPDAPCNILAINGVLLGSGGTGLAYTISYTTGRATAVIITNGGSGYGANLVDAPVIFSLPASPSGYAGANACINSKVITNGRLQSITIGNAGGRYKNPTIAITGGRITPETTVYNPVYLSQPKLLGVKMLTNGRGYTKPPIASVSQGSVSVSNGDMPLNAEMSQSRLVEPNYVYTIKLDGVQFNTTSYSNTDKKALPTIAICSLNEMVNNEEYSKLILPAQVINDITINITERDGSGLDINKNLLLTMEVEEFDHTETIFEESKRQDF